MSKHTAGKWKVGGKDGSIVYSALDGYADGKKWELEKMKAIKDIEGLI